MIVAGLVGAGFFGWYVEVSKLYKTSILICLTGFMSSIFMMAFVLYSGNIIWNGLACFLMGFGALPLLPLCFDLACEITFPVGEAFTTGLLMTGGQIVGVVEVIIKFHRIFMLIFKKVLIFDFAFAGNEKINSVEALVILFGLTFLGLVSCFFIKQNLVRSNKECVHESVRQSVLSHRRSQLSHHSHSKESKII